MESIGEKLRLAREKNNLTVEQIARDTHVARRFLKALEDEDFSVFPGETYAMGFLRNYSDYLGLNAEEMVGLYRNLKIQEQPLPMNELLDTRPKVSPRLLILIGGAVLAALAVGGILIWRLAGPRGAGDGTSQSQSLLKKENAEFVFQEEVRTKWFKEGDVISVPVGDKSFKLQIVSVGDILTVRVPGGTMELTLGKERVMDLDPESKLALKVVWNDVDRTSAEKRANIGLYRISGTASVEPAGDAAAGTASGQTGTAAQTGSSAAAPAGQTAATTPAAGAQGTTPAAAATPAPATPAPAGPTPAARPAAFKTTSVARSSEVSEFTIDLSFRDNCLFRFLIDGNGNEKEDKFFQKGEQFSLDAKQGITLWLSNAGAVKAKIGGKDLDLGRLGEVATRRIAWRQDASTGEYVLEITALH